MILAIIIVVVVLLLKAVSVRREYQKRGKDIIALYAVLNQQQKDRYMIRDCPQVVYRANTLRRGGIK